MRAAIYARFSTEKQSENSIADQFRVCERLAERHGFTVAARFSDAAISGGTADRPGYQAMLEAARRHEFDVIVAEDTSRLWRLLAEQAPRLAELADLGIAVVTHDLDTRSESAAVLGAVNGAMSEQYRKEIARRTRRGLEGLARQQKSTGGRAYGYVSATGSPSGVREIHAEQAAIVRRIFEAYAGGMSARSIANELNQAGIASPGSSWNRTTRRARGWVMTAIAGDATRGIGILNNELYVGKVIWNRFRWVRSAADASKRRCVQNPREEWIVHQDERLRIIPQDLWERVKERQAERASLIGARLEAGVAPAKARHTGRNGRYLFSGLLVCGECGGRFVMADARSYACSSRIQGGPHLCSNDVRVRRQVVESGLLAGIKTQLLAPEVVQEAVRAAVKLLQQHEKRPAADAKAVAALEAQVANLVEALASGALKHSPALADRLTKAERELAQLKASQPGSGGAAKVLKHAPRLADQYRQLVRDLESSLVGEHIPRARAELRKLLGGEVRIVATPAEILFETEKGRMEAALLRAAGGLPIDVVAGAGFGHYLLRLPRQ